MPFESENLTHASCQECGKRFSYVRKAKLRIYCSDSCRLRFADRERRKRRGHNVGSGEQKRENKKCYYCGCNFIPKASDRIKYCSRDCSYAAQKEKARKPSKTPAAKRYLYIGDCVVCGKEFASQFKQQKTCSNDCSKQLTSEKYNARRARKSRAASELVYPIQILERDGWECKICGCQTPKHKRGTYAKDAPEVDHIKPLASGGSHTRDNLQCACHLCNRRKGYKLSFAP